MIVMLSPLVLSDLNTRISKGSQKQLDRTQVRILQGTNISHLGKRKIIFKSTLVWDMLVSRRVFTRKKSALNHTWQADDQKSESLRFSMTKQMDGKRQLLLEDLGMLMNLGSLKSAWISHGWDVSSQSASSHFAVRPVKQECGGEFSQSIVWPPAFVEKFESQQNIHQNPSQCNWKPAAMARYSTVQTSVSVDKNSII